jgi:hypothetical protein
MNLYQVGDLVRISAVFRDIAGALVDPSTVSLKVTKPSGAQNTYTFALSQVIKDSTGNYHYDAAPTRRACGATPGARPARARRPRTASSAWRPRNEGRAMRAEPMRAAQ